MAKPHKLPLIELEVMNAVWALDGAATTPQVSAVINRGDKRRAPQTILTMLTRLEKKGFLKSEKLSKERAFTPVITRAEYMEFESGEFIDTFGRNALLGMVSSLYEGKKIGDDDINELREWIDAIQK